MSLVSTTQPVASSLPPRAEGMPRHVAIIMDGNGRWAAAQGLPRLMGHQKGVATVRTVTEACAVRGIEVLTLYSFSSENWSRAAEEVEGLMGLARIQLAVQRTELRKNNVRVLHLGRREGLPTQVLEELDKTVSATAACTGITLVAALNYGSRAEIVDAARELAKRVAEGGLAPQEITESMFASCLGTAGLPDPDLVIRTAGEMRLSNYLLWQASYAEFISVPTLWPDFNEDDLSRALEDFRRRTRTFGGRR
ncbi:MAG: polyprenyl diphosphate synthase [Planctomycetota bacterium]|nr:polyprenyl diphosphate synthase [Planctomycetota bacterium]MDA1105045.1 polyprenyl diphosphate synthase [Planctomycetota bacterium]